MKRGDVVIIKDGSYSQSIVAGKLIKESLNYGDEKGRKYRIIETGCVFPHDDAQDSSRKRDTFNNTVIQNIDSGKVVFLEERFLQLTTSIREVSMAEVCRQFGEEVKIRRG